MLVPACQDKPQVSEDEAEQEEAVVLTETEEEEEEASPTEAGPGQSAASMVAQTPVAPAAPAETKEAIVLSSQEEVENGERPPQAAPVSEECGLAAPVESEGHEEGCSQVVVPKVEMTDSQIPEGYYDEDKPLVKEEGKLEEEKKVGCGNMKEMEKELNKLKKIQAAKCLGSASLLCQYVFVLEFHLEF